MNSMSFIPLFARSLQTALRVFNRANSSRSTRKKEENIQNRWKRKRKKETNIYREKLEKLIKIIEKKRLQCKTVFKFT